MHHCPLRACLSVLLVLALLSMLPPRTAMAMAMPMQGGMQDMPMQHGMGRMVNHISLDHAASHHGQDDQCHCGAHCGLCHSMLSSAMAPSYSGLGVTPAGLQPSSLVEIYLSPDPHPPRA
jgi:hypothetical protein